MGQTKPGKYQQTVQKHNKKTTTDKDMGGNRGLNTQHVIDGIGTRCDGGQDKTNGK
jgi:hypothetical protein